MSDAVTFRPGNLILPAGNRSAFVRDAVRFYLAIGEDARLAAVILADRYLTRDDEGWFPLVTAIHESIKGVIP
jgi:hypothetical protein